MLDILAGNSLLLLFTVIGVGYLVGSLSIGGFRLGAAAVLFAGIGFGALDARLVLPEHIYVIGLVMFVYAIGLQSGPSFFRSFQRRGLRFSLITIIFLTGAALLTGALSLLMGISAPSAAGLFCGALTNTPALAAAVEATTGFAANLEPAAREQLAASPVVSYGLAYPFGVFGVILWMYVYSRFHRKPVVEISDEAGGVPLIASVTLRVRNPGVIGQTVGELFASMKDPGFTLSRIRKGDRSIVVEDETVLESGDVVVAVGIPEGLVRARLLFGELVPEHLAEGVDGITYRRLFVSNKDVVGRTIRELHLGRTHHATITRLRRGDVDIVPSPDTILEMGDRIRVVTYRENMDTISRYFGDSVLSIAETDFLSLSLGIVLGAFLGMVSIPLPNGMEFRLGFAGGPLIAGLVLGRLGRTGPIIWAMPTNANFVLRQVGLVFFLAAIGTRAGLGFLDTVRTGGWTLMAAGALVTTVTTLSVLSIGVRFLRLPFAAACGMMAGLQTQPAVLVYANQQSQSDVPNTWYATVYPAAMVAKIMLAEIIVSTVLTH
ncbi:MAG TPA: aspartate:alanine exchanger family transporter [Candidatus Krumholzibacteria bacterium]|nr:aspartate:alanine exchanger family transporter [Candidatus Krumholzibacteria bacterium]HPD72487.1 aspartate:alanine exchanger family transporter [Candidatus Krumholzibacteria bacterium]HRY40581.1 aspartate:alanine exchanger family transporter [Candidatus Krumholzibacteria bacterium]